MHQHDGSVAGTDFGEVGKGVSSASHTEAENEDFDPLAFQRRAGERSNPSDGPQFWRETSDRKFGGLRGAANRACYSAMVS